MTVTELIDMLRALNAPGAEVILSVPVSWGDGHEGDTPIEEEHDVVGIRALPRRGPTRLVELSHELRLGTG